MIDLNRAPGRIVFIEAVEQDRLVGRRGVIVDVRGERTVVNFPGEEKPRFAYKIAAVCDTEQEAKRIEQMDKDYHHNVTTVRKHFQQQWGGLFK